MEKITAQTLLKTYLYLMSLITLTVALFTGAMLIKVGISQFTPLEFSYNLSIANTPADMKEYSLEKCYDDAKVVNIDGKEYCWDENIRKQDLINGGTIFLSMVILFALHQFGIKQTEKMKTPMWLLKGYTFISLMLYSITGVIAIPTAIYQTVNYLLNNTSTYSTLYAPAYSIGLVILALPLWYIFFKKTLHLKDEE